MLVRHRDDGSRTAAQSTRLAQALHHGTDLGARSAPLTTLGMVPPEMDVWDYSLETGT